MERSSSLWSWASHGFCYANLGPLPLSGGIGKWEEPPTRDTLWYPSTTKLVGGRVMSRSKRLWDPREHGGRHWRQKETL
jgi:hypothetical protein